VIERANISRQSSAAERNLDQREMLLPIGGSSKGKEAAKEPAKEPANTPGRQPL